MKDKRDAVAAMQKARERMKRHQPGSDQWWVAFYDLRKAEAMLDQ